MAVSDERVRAALRWALTDGIGPRIFAAVVKHFGDPVTALSASPDALRGVKGIGSEKLAAILSGPGDGVIERELDACAAHGVRLITRDDDEYPPGLKQIPDAPIVLYVKGELRPTDAVAVAIVGSRRCSIYGSEQARRFGELLAGAGFTVVSGLARGIDSFAHHGAVDAGGRSIAVMGAGLHEIYPPENAALAAKLIDHGAWISELPMTAPVRAANFPARNRIIAGMSLGTLVIEAAARSGALITARLAIEYNRDIFAVPGRVQDPMSIGANALIRDSGAKLVTCLEDILSALGDVGAAMTKHSDKPAEPSGQQRDLFSRSPGGDGSPSPGAGLSLSGIESRVYGIVGYEPMLQDAIIRAAGVGPGEVLGAITTLELKGLVRRLPGNLVQRRGTA